MIGDEEYSEMSFYKNKIVSFASRNFFESSSYDENDQTSLDPYSIWCLDINQRLDSEFYFPPSPILQSPRVNSSKLNRFPYRYSIWKSSSDLSRGFNRCEHHLAMRLFMIIDRICRKYHIEYMLFDGTLLGSWRHHDVIPWDDDLDIIVDDKRRNDLISIIKGMENTSVKFDKFPGGSEDQDFYKISLKNTPSAGSRPWNFPFLDIFFYRKNQTHFWSRNEPHKVYNIEHTYPLTMRPMGELWLPSPRSPEKFFPFDPYQTCKGKSYNHRKEKGGPEITLRCKRLFDVYPFVHRDNHSNSTEILKLNNQTIHTVIFN